MDADYQKVSQVLTNLNADSPLSGKRSKIGLKNHNQSSKKAFFVVIFHEVLHQFFWHSCSISSALWWISQPYSARAVRLEQRASVTNHTFDQGSYCNSRSKILEDLETKNSLFNDIDDEQESVSFPGQNLMDLKLPTVAYYDR